MPPLASPRRDRAAAIPHGLSGQNSVTPFHVTPSSKTSQTLCPFYKFSLHATEWEHWLPHQVKPVPLQILLHVTSFNLRTSDPKQNAISQMIILGFFFLLRPSEYAKMDNPDAAPFRFCDVHLML